jgi:phenylacetate-CoA ligase
MNLHEIIRSLVFYNKQAAKYAYSCVPFNFRHGSTFRRTYHLLRESQYWTKEQLADYQMLELMHILKHAYENVPYYRKVFDERGLRPEDIQTFEDMGKLPFLTKEIIRKESQNLLAKNISHADLEPVTTGGTSGIPLDFFHQRKITRERELAFTWRHWDWAGVKPKDKRLVLRGFETERFKGCKEDWWKYDPIGKALQLSSFQMSRENMPKYIEKIMEFRPTVIQGYPSSLHHLSKFIVKSGTDLNFVKCVLTSSETLYPEQRKLFERAFGARVYDHYGHNERVALVMQCEIGTYHEISEYSFVELIREDGSLIKNANSVGEMVGTGFTNYAMPFIRYKTNDMARYSEGDCNCGRKYSVITSIEGRKQNYFIDRSGAPISFTVSDECLYGINDVVDGYQYVQTEPGKVVLRIESNRNLRSIEIETVKHLFLKRYNRLDIEIVMAESIPRTKRGKFEYLIQKLPVVFDV